MRNVAESLLICPEKRDERGGSFAFGDFVRGCAGQHGFGCDDVGVRRGEEIDLGKEGRGFVYAVEKGSIKLVCHQPGSPRETILALLGPGEVFGGIANGAVCGGECRAVAIGAPTVLLRCAVLDFERVLASYPEAAGAMSRMMIVRLGKLEARLSQVLFKDSRQRVAYVLLDLLDDWGAEHPAGRLLNLRVTHQDIASLAGLTRETVSMALAEFELEEAIRTFGRKIVVARAEVLADVRDGRRRMGEMGL